MNYIFFVSLLTKWQHIFEEIAFDDLSLWMIRMTFEQNAQ